MPKKQSNNPYFLWKATEYPRIRDEILASDRTGKYSKGNKLVPEIGKRLGAEWRKITGKPPQPKREKHLRNVYVEVDGVKTRTFRKLNGNVNKNPNKVCTLGMDKDGYCLTDPKYTGPLTTTRSCVTSQRRKLRAANLNVEVAAEKEKKSKARKPKSKSKSTSASTKPKAHKPKSTSASTKPKAHKPKPHSKSTSASTKPKAHKPKPHSKSTSASAKPKAHKPKPHSKSTSASTKPKASKPKPKSKSTSAKPKAHKPKPKSKSKSTSSSTKSKAKKPTKSLIAGGPKPKLYNKGYHASDATKNASLWGIFGGGDDKSKKKKSRSKKHAEAYSVGSSASSSSEWHSESYKAKHGKKHRAPGYAVLNTSALLSYA